MKSGHHKLISNTTIDSEIKGLRGQKGLVPFSEELSKACSLLQSSHTALARNQLEDAKSNALSACNTINKLLKSPNKPLQKIIGQLAQYALVYYKRLLETGAAALSAQEKFGWLTSTAAVTGGFWVPTIFFGEYCSANIAPLESSDDSIQVPTFSPRNPVEFRALEQSLHASVSNLSMKDTDSSDSLDDLYQDVLSDCSFVSSLLSISELGLAHKVRELVTIFDNGTAKVRLYANGFWREVAVTTKLPHFVLSQDRYLFVRSATRSSLLWPALVEKAYVTAFEENYSFGGSNMANDTFMLTGWLPEICSTSQTSQETLAGLWDGKVRGDLMIGLGTGAISSEMEQHLGIISNHDYVLNQYDKEHSSFTLLNPWAFQRNKDKRAQRKLNIDRSLFRHFKFLYLNWRPHHKNENKSYFVSRPSKWPIGFLGDKPQFHFCNESKEKEEIWILVEKFHESKADFCVSVWQGAKQLVYTNCQYYCVSGGKFVNSKHQLIKLVLEPNEDYIVSVVSKDEHTSKFCLTVHHDMNDFNILKARSSYEHTLPIVAGHWGQGTAGGNWSNETFINNPQYDLELKTSSRCMMILATENENLDVNVHLIHCSSKDKGRKIRNFDQSSLVFNEKYTNRLFYQSVDNVEPGNYKLLVSAYNRGDSGDFKLLFAHDGDAPLETVPTPQALGTFIKDISFEWKSSNRSKLKIISFHNNTNITIHVRSGKDEVQQMNNYRPAIRASVFNALTGQPVVITNQWSDSVYGIFVDCCLPESGHSYVLLVERFETGEGVCRISAGSNHRITIQEDNDL